MSIDTQLKLSGLRTGRIILHILTIQKDQKFVWHMKGIIREFHQKK